MPVTPTSKIWMDGDLVDWEDARIHVVTQTLHIGWGVFEGLRVYETAAGPAAFRLTDHIERLFRSASLYYMRPEFTPDEIRTAVLDVVHANGLPACYVRPMFYLGYGEVGLNPLNAATCAVVMSWPWDAYLGAEATLRGVRAMVSSWQRIGANVIPPQGKANGQYINSALAKVQALHAGYDEAIMLNSDGRVAEGSAENIFVVRDGIVVTPPLEDGILPGITRDTVMALARDAGYEVVERSLVRADLYLAEEAFFTGTAAEVVPLVEVDDHPIGTGKPGRVTADLVERYRAVIRGENPHFKSWNEHT